MQNVLSTLLAMLLVINASCACASVADKADAGPHAHHQQFEPAMPGTDCPHSDCQNDCEKAVGVIPSKDSTQPTSYKFGLEDVEWAAIDFAPIVLGGTIQTTGPPLTPISLAASTPVRRFDLQLE